MTHPDLDFAKRRDAERKHFEAEVVRAAVVRNDPKRAVRSSGMEDVVLPPQEYKWWQNKRARENKLLQRLQREHVLGSVSNPRVRELVEAAHAAANRHGGVVRWIRSGDDYLDRVSMSVSADARLYRSWVWSELQSSDLARLLPGGRENLPDIYEAMGEPWRSLERLFEPRNYRQLIAHLVRHLDWYLDPTQRPKPPIWQVSFGLAVIVLLALWGALAHYGVRISGGYMWGYVVKAVAVGFATLGARFYGGQKVGNAKVHNYYRQRGLINSAELYYYLSNYYAELPEKEPEGEPNPAQL